MRVGDVIDGKYRLVRLLGEGGMGAVYEVRHEVIGQRLALKCLRAQAATGELASRFIQEAQAAAAVGSQHIVYVTDAGACPDGRPYLVMEFLEGESVEALIARAGTLEPAHAARIMLQVCAGLEAAHEKKIVHRDVKPANLFLTRHGDNPEWVKVLDFGIAKVHAEVSGASQSLTRAGATLGTPGYMAPEQILSAREVDHRADIYACGAILYEMLTGQRPFAAETYEALIVAVATRPPTSPRLVNPAVPAGLEAVVLRALAKDAGERWQSMAELAQALEPFAGEPRRGDGVAAGADRADDAWARSPTLPAVEPARPIAQLPDTVPATAPPAGGEPTPVPAATPSERRLPTTVAADSLRAARSRSRTRTKLVLGLALGLGALAAMPITAAIVAARSWHDEAHASAGATLERSVPASPSDAAPKPPGPIALASNPPAAPAAAPAAPAAAPQACPTWRLMNSGHCCWPGEGWDGARCACRDAARCASGAAPPFAVKAPGTWVAIRAGSFTMGSPLHELSRSPTEVQHLVTLTQDFLMQATEVTQAQFEGLMGYNPARRASCRDCPVDQVTWFEAAAYCNALSSGEGLESCYQCAGSGREVRCAPPESGTPYRCAGYRLPTQAEWEYAARAGTTSATYNGDSEPGQSGCGHPRSNVLDPIAWFCGNGDFASHPVSTKRPNTWGLHDLLGNVWELTHDRFSPYDQLPAVAIDPWVAGGDSRYVVRGGSFSTSITRTRAAVRWFIDAEDRDEEVGFRPARSLR